MDDENSRFQRSKMNILLYDGCIQSYISPGFSKLPVSVIEHVIPLAMISRAEEGFVS
jgi:hypothetical protein